MPLKLRHATSADAHALTDILHQARISRGHSEETPLQIRDKCWNSDATVSSVAVTVAERGGHPVAFCGPSLQDEETLVIDFLCVVPEAQGQGIGDLLLTRAEDEARSRNLTRLFLETDTSTATFYEKRGFRITATRASDMQPGGEVHMMEKLLQPGVHKVSSIDIGLSPEPWAFETTNEAAIAAHFEEARQRISLLWNGRTLKLTNFRFEDGAFMGTCCECSYAAFLAWREWGAPDASAYNLFGSAVLRSADGALLYGVMSERAVTAGLIYPPGGNLDPVDLTRDGKVDVVGAIYRELAEETGLSESDVHPGDLLVAFDGPRIALAQIFHIDKKAADLRDSILRFSEASEEQELADIRIIRSREDLADPAIVPYARAIGAYLLPHASP